MLQRTGSMEYDYPITPKSVLYSITVPVKENIILVSKSMYKCIPLLNLWVLNIQVYTSTYYYISSGTPINIIYGICMVYTIHIPCILHIQVYVWYIPYIYIVY